jgi:replicative DNA helicase
MTRNLVDVEHEEAYLGALLMDGSVLEEHPVDEAVFAADHRRLVYRLACQIIREGKQADIIAVLHAVRADAARNHEHWHDLISSAWLSDLTSNLPSSANASFYAQSITELATLRRLNLLARQIGIEVGDASRSPQSIMADIEGTLTDLAMGKSAGYRRISEALRPTIEGIEAAWNRRGQLSGIPTGFPGLDEMTGGLQRQEVVIIGARPGTGKTSIALNMAEAAIRADRRVGMFSCEMGSQMLCRRLISAVAAMDARKLTTGMLTTADFADIQDAAGWLHGAGLFVDDTPNVPWADLVSGARKMRRSEGIDLLIVDYLGLIRHPDPRMPRHEQVAEISKGLKQLARELDIPVVVLSQLSREAQGKRPNLAQLRESGSVEQDADVVVLLWNQGWVDEGTRDLVKVTLIVEKNRNGGVGDVDMAFKPATTRFREAA